MRASVNEESRVESSNFYNIQSPFCVDQLVASLVLHNIWRSDQSDSTPDIPGKILLPGPRKSPDRSRRGVWSGDETTRIDNTHNGIGDCVT